MSYRRVHFTALLAILTMAASELRAQPWPPLDRSYRDPPFASSSGTTVLPSYPSTTYAPIRESQGASQWGASGSRGSRYVEPPASGFRSLPDPRTMPLVGSPGYGDFDAPRPVPQPAPVPSPPPYDGYAQYGASDYGYAPFEYPLTAPTRAAGSRATPRGPAYVGPEFDNSYSYPPPVRQPAAGFAGGERWTPPPAVPRPMVEPEEYGSGNYPPRDSYGGSLLETPPGPTYSGGRSAENASWRKRLPGDSYKGIETPPPGSDPKPGPGTKDAPAAGKDKPLSPVEDLCGGFQLWSFELDVVGFHRTGPNNHDLLLTNTGAVALNAANLDLDYRLGAHADLVHQTSYGYAWELGYLGVPWWSRAELTQGNLVFPGPGFTMAANSAVFSMDYESSLHSGEINLRQGEAGDACWLVGFRYWRMSDALTVSELRSGTLGLLDIASENNLYGIQFGGDYRLYDRGGRMHAKLNVKFGLYTNDIHDRTSSVLFPTELREGERKLAYSGEAALSIGFRITKQLEVLGTYQLIGLGGVALAPDQIRSTDLATGRSAIQTSSLLLDGGMLGLRYSW